MMTWYKRETWLFLFTKKNIHNNKYIVNVIYRSSLGMEAAAPGECPSRRITYIVG